MVGKRMLVLLNFPISIELLWKGGIALCSLAEEEWYKTEMFYLFLNEYYLCEEVKISLKATIIYTFGESNIYFSQMFQIETDLI